MKLEIIWLRFHKKYIEKKKLKFVRWFHYLAPHKYCWADCVAYSFTASRFNPFRIDNEKGCKAESETHMNKSCYCGSWQNGKCWDKLPQCEKDEYKRQIEVYNSTHKDELPF
jgi:hypothetical protein